MGVEKFGRSSRKGVNVLYRNIPFIFFIVFLGLIYIANSHVAEKKVRKIESLKKQAQTLKWEYWSLQSQIMYGSTQSALTEKVSSFGLLEPSDSPKRIQVKVEEP